MQVPTDDEFDKIISKALDSLPKKYTSRLNNIAIIYADVPSLEQRQKLQLADNQSLYGLYEGIPLPARGGTQPILPDKITIFKIPLFASSRNEEELLENVRHTLWHEMAHYFGLNHRQIHERE